MKAVKGYAWASKSDASVACSPHDPIDPEFEFWAWHHFETFEARDEWLAERDWLEVTWDD